MVKLFLIIILVFSISVGFIFNVGCVDAIGVTSPYSGSELVLKLPPGGEREVFLGLVNFDIEEGISMQGEILNGSEIAFLDESIFQVPYESKDVFVKMDVKIPKNADLGERYNIIYEFKQVGAVEGGMVAFSQGIVRNFEVVVIEEESGILGLGEEKIDIGKGISLIWIILGIVLIVIIIIVIWFVVKSREEENLLIDSGL